jgi:hypothetical protein
VLNGLLIVFREYFKVVHANEGHANAISRYEMFFDLQLNLKLHHQSRRQLQ